MSGAGDIGRDQPAPLIELIPSRPLATRNGQQTRGGQQPGTVTE
jgi:hypothetical protein